MEKAKFKIGDKVKVTNYGYTYTTYGEKFELMGFENTQYNGSIRDKEVGTIFGVTLHEDKDTILYAIRTLDDNREALIGEEGLIKIKDAPKMYSEEEVLEFANWCRIQDNKYPNKVITIQQLFEQFKNK